MKRLLSILCLVLFAGCEPRDERVSAETIRIPMGGSETLSYRIVTVNGQDYFVISVNGGYSMCPKLR